MPFRPGARELNHLRDVNLPTSAQGDILIRAASLWERLAAGSASQVLKTQGPAANPEWAGVPPDDAVAISYLGVW
jgi:hypothetical protein